VGAGPGRGRVAPGVTQRAPFPPKTPEQGSCSGLKLSFSWWFCFTQAETNFNEVSFLSDANWLPVLPGGLARGLRAAGP
jgi:hypothetical protein